MAFVTRRADPDYMKADGHLGRCYLKGREGDAANAILTAVGHNLRLVLTWLRSSFALDSVPTSPRVRIPNAAQISFLTANSVARRSLMQRRALMPMSPIGSIMRY